METYAEENERKIIEKYKELAELENDEKKLITACERLNALAIFYRRNRKYNEAIETYQEAIDIYGNLENSEGLGTKHGLSICWNNLGNCYSDFNQADNALKAYQNALRIRYELSKIDLIKYTPDTSMTLNALGILYSKHNFLEEAEDCYLSALNLRRMLFCSDEEKHVSDLTQSIVNLSTFYFMHIKKTQESIELAKECIKLAEEFNTIPAMLQYKDTALSLLKINNR